MKTILKFVSDKMSDIKLFISFLMISFSILHFWGEWGLVLVIGICFLLVDIIEDCEK